MSEFLNANNLAWARQITEHRRWTVLRVYMTGSQRGDFLFRAEDVNAPKRHGMFGNLPPSIAPIYDSEDEAKQAAESLANSHQGIYAVLELASVVSPSVQGVWLQAPTKGSWAYSAENPKPFSDESLTGEPADAPHP